MKNKDIFYAPMIQDSLHLSEEESRHCVKVLRKTEGDEILITDGKGVFYLATIDDANAKSCKVQINSIEKVGKSWNFDLTIAFAPTKNTDRIEWFVEKSTEIGIDNFIPFLSNNSERKILKTDRLNKVIVSACKQSQKAFYPCLSELTTFKQLLTMPFLGEKYIAHCYDTPKQLLVDIYTKSSSVLILIGPEGDFTADEVKLAEEKGFTSISLSSERLRTETAALFACSTVQVLNL